jgi:hypothetical protein
VGVRVRGLEKMVVQRNEAQLALAHLSNFKFKFFLLFFANGLATFINDGMGV